MWKRSFDSDPITATTAMPLSLRPSPDAARILPSTPFNSSGLARRGGATIPSRCRCGLEPSASAEAQDAVVLAGLHADLLSRVRGRGRHPLLEERELVVGELAAVGFERGELDVDEPTDVLSVVRLERVREPDLGHVPYLQPFGQMLGKEVRVPGGGSHRVQHDLAAHAVIAVVVVRELLVAEEPGA